MKYQIEFRYFDNDTKKYVVIDRSTPHSHKGVLISSKGLDINSKGKAQQVIGSVSGQQQREQPHT